MDYKVQSVLFLKSKWNETTASKWLMEHSYKIKKVDITEKHLRFRQLNPDYLKKLGYIQYATKNIGDGISLILVYKDGGQEGGAISVANVKKFIDASYKKNPDERIDDYILDKSLSNDYAKTYYNPKTKQAVVVHRGTSGASDWLNNVAYASGVYTYTNRYKTGKQIQEKAYKKYGKSNVSTLGHSQGAVLSRKLGADSKEIINVNPAYMGETKGKNEYNIRSSSDLVSGILAPVNVLSSTLFPKYTKNHEITIQSDNPVDVLTEHSPEILNRLEQDRMIGKGMKGGANNPAQNRTYTRIITRYNNILGSNELTIDKLELLDDLVDTAEHLRDMNPVLEELMNHLLQHMYQTQLDYQHEIDVGANEEAEVIYEDPTPFNDGDTIVPIYNPYDNEPVSEDETFVPPHTEPNAGDETDDEMAGAGIESNAYLFRILSNAFKKLTDMKQEAQLRGNTELMGDYTTPFAQLISQLYSELMVSHLDTRLEGEQLNSYLSTRIRDVEAVMGRQFLEYDDAKLGGRMKGGIKSPFCRTGSKFSMRNMIVPIIPAHKVYVELFAGSASIFFSKEKAEVNVLNDLDTSVINKFKALVKAPDNIKSYNTDLNTRDKIRHFYDNHSNTPQNKLLLEKITSCNGFGSKPVKYSGMIYKGSNPYNSLVKHLPEYKELLKGVKLETKDYEKIVKKYDSPQTFFFIDPPYENTNTSFGYAEDVKFDFIRLRKVLDKIKGSFLLTINDSAQIRSLFKGFKLTPVKITSGFRNAGLGKNTGDFDKSRGELMITNYTPENIEGGRKTREQMSEKTRKLLEEKEARTPPFTYSFLDEEAFENEIMATWHGLQMQGVPLVEVKKIIAGIREEKEQAVSNYLTQMEAEGEDDDENLQHPYTDYDDDDYSEEEEEEKKKEGGAIYEECHGYCGGVIEFNDSDDEMCGGGNPFGRNRRRIAPAPVEDDADDDTEDLIDDAEGIIEEINAEEQGYIGELEYATENDNEIEMGRLITLINHCGIRRNYWEDILQDLNALNDEDEDEDEEGVIHFNNHQIHPAPDDDDEDMAEQKDGRTGAGMYCYA